MKNNLCTTTRNKHVTILQSGSPFQEIESEIAKHFFALPISRSWDRETSDCVVRVYFRVPGAGPLARWLLFREGAMKARKQVSLAMAKGDW